jgi:hypothetical protein
MPKYKRKNTSVHGYGNQSVAMYENENVYNRGYNGSFTGINNPKAAETFAEKQLKTFRKILVLCNHNTVIAQNLVALVLAATLRPLAIMSLPGKKNKDDKKFASAHSIASGVIGFGFSSLIMAPFDKAAKLSKHSIQVVEAAEAFRTNGEGLTPQRFEEIKANFGAANLEDLKKSKIFNSVKKFLNIETLEELENSKFVKDLQDTFNVKTMKDITKSKAFKNVTKVLDMSPDVIFFGVLKAILTIKLIKPILKYVFGMEKTKPVEQPKNNYLTPEQVKSKYGLDMAKTPKITEFVGGNK